MVDFFNSLGSIATFLFSIAFTIFEIAIAFLIVAFGISAIIGCFPRSKRKVDEENEELKKKNEELEKKNEELEKLRADFDKYKKEHPDTPSAPVATPPMIDSAEGRILYNAALSNLKKTFSPNIEKMLDSVLIGRLNNALESNISLFDFQAKMRSADSKEIRTVTLTSCTCPDHINRKIPCKHMLFLAYTLAILQINYEDVKRYHDYSLQSINQNVKKETILKEEISKAEKHKKALATQCSDLNQLKNQYIDDLAKITEEGLQSLPHFAALIADLQTLYFEKAATILETKDHPAHTEAMRIRELKIHARCFLEEKNKLKYQLQYLQSHFPEIAEILSDNGENIKNRQPKPPIK